MNRVPARCTWMKMNSIPRVRAIPSARGNFINRRALHLCRMSAVALLCLCNAAAWCGNAAPEAHSELTPDDVEAIKALFTKMADGFAKGDAHSVMQLFANKTSKRHERISECVEREFAQVRYSDVKILAVSADESLTRKRHSVDVTMQMRIIAASAEGDRASSGQAPPDLATTTESFIVQRFEDGSFMLVDSSFFDKLGLKQGVGIVVDAVLAVMALVAALAFWVWMGFESYRARPRNRSWRIVVYGVPVLGALLYFVLKYIPGQMAAPPTLEHSN